MIAICELTSGITTSAWLCRDHQQNRRDSGWSVKVVRAMPWGGCDDCTAESQSAPGYATPPVAFVPTRTESFCPAPGWKAPVVPETWTARLTRMKAEGRR